MVKTLKLESTSLGKLLRGLIENQMEGLHNVTIIPYAFLDATCTELQYCIIVSSRFFVSLFPN